MIQDGPCNHMGTTTALVSGDVSVLRCFQCVELHMNKPGLAKKSVLMFADEKRARDRRCVSGRAPAQTL